MGLFTKPAGYVSFWSEGDHPLNAREQAGVTALLAPGEVTACFARGRTDGKHTIWALTNDRLLIVGLGMMARSIAEPLAGLTAIETQEGAHGHTIRLTSAAGRRSLVAVAAPASRSFTEYLASRSTVSPAFIASLRTKPPSELAAERRAMAERTIPVPAPASVVVPAPATEPPRPSPDALVGRLAQAAQLHRDGSLTDVEFARLKQKLLAD